MGRLGGGGLLVTGAIIFLLGIVLRWDLIAWLIDATGFVLIVIGIIVMVVGIIGMLKGGGRRERDL